MSTRRELAERFAMLQRGVTPPGDKADEMLRRMADIAPDEATRDRIRAEIARQKPSRSEADREAAIAHHIAKRQLAPLDELPDYDIPVAKPPPEPKAKAVNLTDRKLSRQFDATADAVTVAWNAGLEFTKAYYKACPITDRKFAPRNNIYDHVMAKHAECRAAPSDAIQAVCDELVSAIFNFIKLRRTANRVPFPAFRKRHMHGGYFVAKRVRLDRAQRRVRLPKLGWVEVDSLKHVPDCHVTRTLIAHRGAHWHMKLKLAMPE